MPHSKAHILELDFATLYFYEMFVISSIHEGVTFDTPHLKELSEVCGQYYGNQPFVSIAHRINDYTINPTCLMQSKAISNLAGIGVVCHSPSTLETARFERKFYKGTYQIFSSLDECKIWAKQLVKIFKEEKKQVYKPDSVL